MFCLNVVLTVKDESRVEEVAGYLAQAGRLSRAEPGCLSFEVCHSQSDRRVFILCERWESERALEDHRQREAFLTIYKPQVLPLVDRVPHPSQILE
jgi:quinol monooxygenase YgiN